MKVNAPPLIVTIILCVASSALSIRFPNRISEYPDGGSEQPLRTAVFALGSFWRSEAAFGCWGGVVRTTAGYAGGSKPNPEYRSLGDHAECVQVLLSSPLHFILNFVRLFRNFGGLVLSRDRSLHLCKLIN